MKYGSKYLAAAILLLGATSSAQNLPLATSHSPGPPAATAAVVPSAIVARVNGAGVTERDVQREMQKQFPYSGVHGNRIPGDFSAEIRRKATQQVILDELLHQEALRKGLVMPRGVFNNLLQQAQRRFPSAAAYESYATQEYGSVKSFQNQIRRGLLVALLLDQEVTQRSRVSGTELQKFYQANKKRFRKPASIWLQSITLQIPTNATPAQQAQIRKRAEAILPQARSANSYEEFGKLAEKFSEDDWRVMMGDHRWIHRGRLPEAIENAAFSLRQGEISGIIASPEALVIVRVNGAQPQTQLPFSQVRQSLQADLQKAKEADLRARLEQRVRKTFKVENL